jgi:hypothetical protein
MVPSCLLWCFWRERNDRSFEDCERTVVDLKSFFFKTLYHWTTALDLNLLSFHDFLDLFSFLQVRCFSCLLLVYLSYAFCAFNDISITYIYIYIYISSGTSIYKKTYKRTMQQTKLIYINQ